MPLLFLGNSEVLRLARYFAMVLSWAIFPWPTCFTEKLCAQEAGTVATLVPDISIASAEVLGADDLVEVAVSYCPEMTRNFRVGVDGTLTVPLLRNPLVVIGLSPMEVAQKISSALVSEHVLVEPIVNVFVVESRSRPISLVGAVNHPMNFQAAGRTTLIEALAKAGGLSPTAGSEIIVTMFEGVSHRQQTRIIAVNELISGKFPAANLALRGGEEIRVPESAKIFVAGNVRRPGAYPMQGGSETTVMKAVALGSGLEVYSGTIAYIYRKRETGVERDELSIPLRRIMTRRAPDVVLQADDILFVPTAEGRRLTAKILGQLAGFGQTAEAALLLAK